MFGVRQLASDHARDHGALGRLLHDDIDDLAPVAQDRRGLADAEHLVHLVRDVDDRDALRRQLGDQDGQALELRRGQARGRLVHGEDLGVLHHGAGDLDDLALGDLEGADGCGRVDGRVERRQGLGGRLLLPAARHEQAASGFQRMAEEHVLRDGELGNVLELLMDHRDPGAAGRYRPVPGNAQRRRSPHAPTRD